MTARSLVLLLAAAACSALLVEPASAQGTANKRFAGIWMGTLDAGGTKLRIVFTISETPTGSLTAKMDSPDQGASGIPVTAVLVRGDSLRIEMLNIMGVYDGAMDKGDSSVTGRWTQSGMSFPLPLKKSVAPPEPPRRPQNPQKPYPYSEQEVVYQNQAAGITLAGTLTIPHGKGPFPAVLLITGSGLQNRDEEIFNHHPFLVLADYLTRRGIAALRVDDRGVGGSTGTPSRATSKDFAGDVLAGVRYLAGRTEIDPRAIGLIGHSEGGIIAPMVAVESPDVAFIVLMAGTALPGSVIINHQLAAIARAGGETGEGVAKFLPLNERVLDLAITEPDSALVITRATALLDSVIATLTPQEKEKYEATLRQQFKVLPQTLMTPWMRFFLSYDPRPMLSRVSCPVLAINGEKDVQVLADENLPLIEKTLKSAGNTRVTVKQLPGLNHLFQTSTTGSPNEYASIEETFSPTALALIGDWIAEQTGRKSQE